MSSMWSGGETPEIRQNYIGGHIVFNTIHAWFQRARPWDKNTRPILVGLPVGHGYVRKNLMAKFIF